tara:strand:- start:346 stop:1011 length:666 start_codon:yes stop_codon:yes gene_type:complete
MNEIEHDGKTYILKSQVESIIKDRVQKVAARATEFENQLNDLQIQYEKSTKENASVDILRNQIKELEAANHKASQKFNRYTAISGYGLTDPEIVEAIEWAYDRTMCKKDEKEKLELGDWLKNCFENPDNAPVILQPHITAARTSGDPLEGSIDEAKEQIAAVSNTPDQNQQIQAAPNTNLGVKNIPDNITSLDKRVFSDPELYEANREAIRKMWYSRRKRG